MPHAHRWNQQTEPMSQTPRTDAAISIMGAVSQEEVVSAEVCRNIELELNAARMALKASEMRYAGDSEVWEMEGCRLQAEVIRLMVGIEASRNMLAEKNETANVFMNQVKKLQEQLGRLAYSDVCSVCNWCNVGCLNLGEPGQPRWVCHGCIKLKFDTA